ncbi:MAG: hypothetical protein LBP55_08100 [Candidatus Adiutrix sp.]|jgi:ABC-type transport system substrate-binding protein|nr:hypothetical protein [Candidatus Adiutrix sp.]
MTRKTLLTLALLLALALCPSPAPAQSPLAGAIPPELEAALKKEPPLTQTDIDAYLKILPQLGSVLSDPAAIAKLSESAGLTDVRFNYITAKIGVSQALAQGATAEQIGLSNFPEVLRPSETEITLVKTNIPKLMEAAMAMTANMPKPAQK